MTETIGITTIITEIGSEGLLLSLGKGLVQLALIVACVVVIRKILKKHLGLTPRQIRRTSVY